MAQRLSVLCAALTLLISGSAAGQVPAKTESQNQALALFSEARKLVEVGDYSKACPKFEQSLRLNLGIGVQFNLADCWEHLGRTASAQALFQGAAASARAVGQVERAEVARARAEALEPRLIRMLIDVRSSDPALVIRRNRVVVEQKSWGAATPIDAGDYWLEATAPNKKSWALRVIVPATTSDLVSITVPPLDDASEAPVAESQAKKKDSGARAIVAPPRSSAPLTARTDVGSRRYAGYSYALAGLGVASLGLGTILAFEFKSKNDQAKGICPNSVGCTAAEVNQHEDLVSDARRFRTLSFLGFGVGGAALLAATVLFVVPSASSGASGLNATPFVTADGSWGASASGRF